MDKNDEKKRNNSSVLIDRYMMPYRDDDSLTGVFTICCTHQAAPKPKQQPQQYT